METCHNEISPTQWKQDTMKLATMKLAQQNGNKLKHRGNKSQDNGNKPQ